LQTTVERQETKRSLEIYLETIEHLLGELKAAAEKKGA
jgi:hypothetical protein